MSEYVCFCIVALIFFLFKEDCLCFYSFYFIFPSLQIFTGPPNLTMLAEIHEKKTKKTARTEMRYMKGWTNSLPAARCSSSLWNICRKNGDSENDAERMQMKGMEIYMRRAKKKMVKHSKLFHAYLDIYLKKCMFVCYFWPAHDASLFNMYKISMIELLAEKHWSILSMTCDKYVYSASVNLDQ